MTETDTDTDTESKPNLRYTKSQWQIFIILAITNILIYIKYSMHAPIFPPEAQRKNASATEFGFVLSSFELTQLIMSPIVGKYAPRFGITHVFNIGILITGISTLLFGFLQFINNHWIFIGGALILRIIDGIGSSAVVVTIYTLVATEFSESMATTMGTMEGFVGLAFCIGPFLGSALYQVGGFILPFNIIGGSLIIIAVFVYFILRGTNNSHVNKMPESLNEIGILSLLNNVPSIYMYLSIVSVTATNVGFFLTLLEVHLQQFNLTPIIVGLIFLLFGAAYTPSAPIFSKLCGSLKIPEMIPLTGIILYITGWILIGPGPFTTLKPTITLIICGVILLGCADACIVSAGFILSIKAAEKSNFEDFSKISSQISGLWSASNSFGLFLGPIIGGILYDLLDFPLASLSMIGIDTIQMICLIFFILWKYTAHFSNTSSSLTTLTTTRTH